MGCLLKLIELNSKKHIKFHKRNAKVKSWFQVKRKDGEFNFLLNIYSLNKKVKQSEIQNKY